MLWQTLRNIWRRGKKSDTIRAMTQAKNIVNPIRWSDIQRDMTRAEHVFADCLSRGGGCVLGDTVPQQSADDIRIRPEVICFFAFGGDSNHQVRGPRISLAGAYICGEYDTKLYHVDIPYVLDFTACHFATAVKLQYASCEALYLWGSHLAKGLGGSGLRTKGSVILRDVKANGEVDLSRARIGGDLDCTNGKFNNPGARAFIANEITVKGPVFLRNVCAKGEVRILKARVGGDFDCKGGVFSNPEKSTLSADGITVDGNIHLNGNFVAEGEVKFSGAKVSGDLNCADGRFHNPGRNALVAPGMTVERNVFMDRNFSSKGEVNMTGVNIGENLDCAGGRFHNPEGEYALNAERMITGGHVFLNQFCNKSFSAHGRVRLANADIGRNFNCKGGQFSHAGDKSAIAAGGLRTRGAVFLSDDFVVQGDVDLHVARIGNFVCKKCGAKSGGVINLSSTKAVAVDDDGGAGEQFEFILDDFTYGIFYPPSPTDSESRLKWLGMRPKERRIKGETVKIPFSPLPYEQAAKVLFGMGQAREAREILLGKERLQTKDERTPWHHKIGRRLWDVFAGYGYRLRKTAAWMAGFVLAGAVFFGIAAHYGQIVPHQPPILSSAEYQAERAKGLSPMESVQAAFPKEYPEFSPLAYSLDVFIPFFALHQEPFWSPASGGDNDLWKASLLLALLVAAALALGGLASLLANWIRREWGDDFAGAGAAGVGMAVVSLLLGVGFAAGFAHVWLDFDLGIWLADWRWLTVWHWLEIGAGWVLTSLFLLSITGLLRPRQSSGEKG